MPHEWTQRTLMHLNGGSKFSELVFQLQCDGKETNITRRRRTSGSPKYLITVDELSSGDESFDVLGTRGVGMREWLDARAPKADGTSQEQVGGTAPASDCSTPKTHA